MFYIGNGCDLSGVDGMSVGPDVGLHRGCWLIVPPCVGSGCGRTFLTVERGSSIGRYSVISATNSVQIGEFVLFGPRVTIVDADHVYCDVSMPILHQGWTEGGSVIIGDNCWIGAGAVIVGTNGVAIGRNSVIGTNSVVTTDIPSHSVAVGSPARVVKQFDPQTGEWQSI